MKTLVFNGSPSTRMIKLQKFLTLFIGIGVVIGAAVISLRRERGKQ
jgi:hypothetical protein